MLGLISGHGVPPTSERMAMIIVASSHVQRQVKRKMSRHAANGSNEYHGACSPGEDGSSQRLCRVASSEEARARRLLHSTPAQPLLEAAHRVPQRAEAEDHGVD